MEAMTLTLTIAAADSGWGGNLEGQYDDGEDDDSEDDDSVDDDGLDDDGSSGWADDGGELDDIFGGVDLERESEDDDAVEDDGSGDDLDEDSDGEVEDVDDEDYEDEGDDDEDEHDEGESWEETNDSPITSRALQQGSAKVRLQVLKRRMFKRSSEQPLYFDVCLKVQEPEMPKSQFKGTVIVFFFL